MRMLWVMLVVMMAGVSAGASVATGQPGRLAIGGAGGAVGGGITTLSIVVARARLLDEYLDHPHDLMHWQSLPMVIGPVLGVSVGRAGAEPLKQTVVGATSGMLLGAATGAALGWMLSDQAEWPWAGAVIGAGMGVSIGGLALGIRSWMREEDRERDEPLRLSFRIAF